MLDDSTRARLERQLIPQFLPRQRWFGGKARQVESVRVVDYATLRAGPTPAELLLARIGYADGGADLYFLPFSGSTDGLANPEVCQLLLGAIADERELPTQEGVIRAVRTAAFAKLRGDPGQPLAATLGPATSSNSLVFFGQQLLLKVFRRLEPGINPDFEIGRFLTEGSCFARTPKMGGALEYHRPGADIVTLAILQQFIPAAVDGWQVVLRHLADFYGHLAAQPPEMSPPEQVTMMPGACTKLIALLGQRTAQLHLALASNPQDPDFAAEPLTGADLAAAIADVQRQSDAALTTLRSNLAHLSDEIGAEARQLLVEAPAALAGLEVDTGTAAKIRIHGDYHLGQVLWTADDFILLDFEGEPTRPVAERRAKQSPLRDVAGMLRSLDYAANAGWFAFLQTRPADFERLWPWADVWQSWTAAAFLREYLQTAAGAVFLPRAPEQTQGLLRLYMLGKAFYELVYELNNRPDWVRIPLRGLLGMLTRKRVGRD